MQQLLKRTHLAPLLKHLGKRCHFCALTRRAEGETLPLILLRAFNPDPFRCLGASEHSGWVGSVGSCDLPWRFLPLAAAAGQPHLGRLWQGGASALPGSSPEGWASGLGGCREDCQVLDLFVLPALPVSGEAEGSEGGRPSLRTGQDAEAVRLPPSEKDYGMELLSSKWPPEVIA